MVRDSEGLNDETFTNTADVHVYGHNYRLLVNPLTDSRLPIYLVTCKKWRSNERWDGGQLDYHDDERTHESIQNM